MSGLNTCLRRAALPELASSSSTHRGSRRICRGVNRCTSVAFVVDRPHTIQSAIGAGHSRSRMPRVPRRGQGVVVKALDAAMPFDFESRAAERIKTERSLNIGIVGFGTFGQFLARRILQHGHKVIAVSRSDYSKQGREMGVKCFTCADDFAEEHPDVVILASSILSTKTVLQSLPLLRFKRSTLFVDVLSVKVFPKQLLLNHLPAEMDILCTHPMFGPDSGKDSWSGLNYQYEKVRINPGSERESRAERFLEIFRTEGCNMVEMTCEAHDQLAANTQFVTHTVGRVLGSMGMESTPINTRGYESLLSLVENTANDSFDLYYGLFMYNQGALRCRMALELSNQSRRYKRPLTIHHSYIEHRTRNSTETLQQLEAAFDDVKKKLFTELHHIVREQIFPPVQKEMLQLPVNATDDESDTESDDSEAGAQQLNGVLTTSVGDGASS